MLNVNVRFTFLIKPSYVYLNVWILLIINVNKYYIIIDIIIYNYIITLNVSGH